MLESGLAFELLLKYIIIAVILLILSGIGNIVWAIYKRRKNKNSLKKEPEKVTSDVKPLSRRQKLLINLPKIIFIVIDVILGGFIGYAVYDCIGDPHVVVMTPVAGDVIAEITQPIYVIFNRPLDANKIKPYIHPEIEGKWELESLDPAFPSVKRKLSFYPATSLPIDQKVFIYYAGIANPFNNKEPWEFAVDTKTTDPVKSAVAEPASGTTDILTDNVVLKFKLDQPAGLFYKWEITIQPEVSHEIVKTSSEVTVKLTQKLAQSTKYTYTLKGTPAVFNLSDETKFELTGDAIDVCSGDFTTVREPLLSAVEPSGNSVHVDANVKIVFDQEMQNSDLTGKISFVPAVNGSANWLDGKTVSFTHDKFNKGTDYKIIVAPGLISKTGGVIEKELSASFTTIGLVKVLSSSPANGAGGVDNNANISFTFNQEVDHGSAQSKFSISPNVAGSFSWNGNTATYNPSSALAYNTKYSIKIASGVKSVHGIDSNQEFAFSFNIKEEYFKLNVPVYYQKLRFSCNLEATRMALAYRGVSKDVMSLYGQIAKDSTPYDAAANTFGDPYSGYTGDIYGVSKGYGVYWGPISNLISNYRSNSIKSGWNVNSLVAEVKAGNPVIIWAHNGYSYAGNVYYWNTPGGKSIRAVTGMHSYVVVGYKGSQDNPTHIILNDSNRGVWTVTTSYFNGLWGYFNNTGIVVY